MGTATTKGKLVSNWKKTTEGGGTPRKIKPSSELVKALNIWVDRDCWSQVRGEHLGK